MGETRNLSSRGALINIDTAAEIGDTVEYTITLTWTAESVVQIRCLGRVMRRNDAEVAVTIERHDFKRWHESIENLYVQAIPVLAQRFEYCLPQPAAMHRNVVGV